MKRFHLLVATLCLIVYGSLYPFKWVQAPPGALEHLFFNWQMTTSWGDMLGNMGLFVPWGLIGMVAMAPRFGNWMGLVWTVFTGFLLALVVQVLQIWVPSRDPALADVVWNLVGISIGLMPGAVLLSLLDSQTKLPHAGLVPGLLLIGFVLAEWLPLVPSLDFQLVKEQLKQLLAAPALDWTALLQRIAMALLAGHLLSKLLDLSKSWVLLPVLLAGVTFGKLFLVDTPMSAATPLGFLLAVVGWFFMTRVSETYRTTAIWLVLLVSYTVSSLSPFGLRNVPASVSWLPFAAMLEGSMLSNVRSVAANLVVFAGILYVGVKTPRHYLLASVSLALWVLMVELAQIWIETRVPDITEPLLVLILGQVLTHVAAPATPGKRQAKHQPHAHQTPTRSFQLPQEKFDAIPLLIKTATALGVMTMAMAAVLQLPGIPYNVTELFRANGNIAALLSVSLAVLWAGAGSAWLASRMEQTNWPALAFAPLVVVVSLVSLTFLWLGVTTESIEDISGSANVFWWVTNRDTWGEFWRKAFLHLNAPEVIGFLEHCVRYTALYAPLPILLGLLITMREAARNGTSPIQSLMRMSGMFVVALVLLWFCKVIAFDWTSTDNLNELIAADGDWGWGGGGYLYGLLLLFCVNSLMLATTHKPNGRHKWASWLLTLISLPIGWWLINQGLEQSVEKYGLTYSGVQFLLGANRTSLLSPEILFLRWCAVQLGAILALSTGLWLGQAAFKATEPKSIDPKACEHT